MVSRGATNCQAEYTGACRIRRCPRDDGGVSSGSDDGATHTSAGEITVSGGTPLFSGTLTPATDDVYEQRAIPPSQPRQFSGLEEVRFRAAGGKLPAFDATVVFPLLLLLEQPVTEAGRLKISSRDDLALVWSRGEPDVQLWLEAVGTDPASPPQVTCRFDSAQGRGTIPKAALAALGPGAVLKLLTVRRQPIQHGSFTTTLMVATEVATPDKKNTVSIEME